MVVKPTGSPYLEAFLGLVECLGTLSYIIKKLTKKTRWLEWRCFCYNIFIYLSVTSTQICIQRLWYSIHSNCSIENANSSFRNSCSAIQKNLGEIKSACTHFGSSSHHPLQWIKKNYIFSLWIKVLFPHFPSLYLLTLITMLFVNLFLIQSV